MSAPASTPRQTPAGIPLWDGFSSKIAPSSNPTISFWEITVQPGKISTGEPISQTTMFNLRVRTFRAPSLLTIGTLKCKVAYDPNLINQLFAIGGVNMAWTQSYPDGSKNDFFGFFQEFDPEPLEEGKRPEATVEIAVTNIDPVAHTEQIPVLTSAPGT